MSDPSQPQYQQPAAPQPPYPQPMQPQYGQPQYGQPYGQPQYEQPPQYQQQPPPYQQQVPQYQQQVPPGYPAYQGWGPPPVQAPRKNRTALIVSLIAAAVVLVVFAGAVAVAYNLTRDDEPAVAASAAGKGSGEKRLRLTAPGTVGPWKKAASQDLAGKLSAAATVDVIEEPFAAQYDNGGVTAVVWGGTGEDIGYDSAAKLFQAFVKGALTISPGTPGTTAPVDPGMIGGEGHCMAIKSGSGNASACFWFANDVTLGLVFTGGEPDAAGGYMKEMLSGLLVFG